MSGRDPDRREFLKAALAAGGTGALSACLGVEGAGDGSTSLSDRRFGPSGDPSLVPERQFEWNSYLPTGPHGNVLLPNHQLLLFLDYDADGTPTDAERDRVEAAFRTLERAYQWGTGDEVDPRTTRGLLFFVGYAPRYFDRYDDDPPDSVTPQRPEDLIEELGEDADPDGADAVLVLSSDRVSVLLSAEQALRGEFDTLNGTEVEAALTEVFDVVDRRTGFLGVGRPAREFDADVPDISPTAMGYRSGFKDNQATEDRVSIGIGPFADGSLLQVSRLRFDLDSWYDHDEESRVRRMFSPEHAPEDVGEIGELLGGQSRITRETVNRIEEDAAEHGIVGHTQKVAAVRTDDFEPKLLRRSEGVSTDLEDPAMNFMSLQRFMSHFTEVRRAMSCPATIGESDTGADAGGCPVHMVDEEDNGIEPFIETLTRGTYLVPPRSLRSLPEPQPDRDR